jgi:hypothetical protein
LLVKMRMVPQAREQVESAQQKADRTKYTAGIGIGKKEELRDRDNDEHQTHHDIHSGGVNATLLGIDVLARTEAVINGQNQSYHNKGK